MVQSPGTCIPYNLCYKDAKIAFKFCKMQFIMQCLIQLANTYQLPTFARYYSGHPFSTLLLLLIKYAQPLKKQWKMFQNQPSEPKEKMPKFAYSHIWARRKIMLLKFKKQYLENLKILHILLLKKQKLTKAMCIMLSLFLKKYIFVHIYAHLDECICTGKVLKGYIQNLFS